MRHACVTTEEDYTELHNWLNMKYTLHIAHFIKPYSDPVHMKNGFLKGFMKLTVFKINKKIYALNISPVYFV